jgi:fused signal recognition particle receptor
MGERNGVAVIHQAGGDPGAVMFDAVNAARGRELTLCWPYGRPIADAGQPDGRAAQDQAGARQGARRCARPVWLVLDANTGQNALAQVRAFDGAVGLTWAILTKLDGSAKAESWQPLPGST